MPSCQRKRPDIAAILGLARVPECESFRFGPVGALGGHIEEEHARGYVIAHMEITLAMARARLSCDVGKNCALS